MAEFNIGFGADSFSRGQRLGRQLSGTSPEDAASDEELQSLAIKATDDFVNGTDSGAFDQFLKISKDKYGMSAIEAATFGETVVGPMIKRAVSRGQITRGRELGGRRGGIVEQLGLGVGTQEIEAEFGKTPGPLDPLGEQRTLESEAKTKLAGAQEGLIPSKIEDFASKGRLRDAKEVFLKGKANKPGVTDVVTTSATERTPSLRSGVLASGQVVTKIRGFFEEFTDEISEGKVDDQNIIRMINDLLKQDGLFLPSDARVKQAKPSIFGFELGGTEFDPEDIFNQLQHFTPGSTTTTTKTLKDEVPGPQSQAVAPVGATPPVEPTPPVAVTDIYQIPSSTTPGMSVGEEKDAEMRVLMSLDLIR